MTCLGVRGETFHFSDFLLGRSVPTLLFLTHSTAAIRGKALNDLVFYVLRLKQNLIEVLDFLIILIYRVCPRFLNTLICLNGFLSRDIFFIHFLQIRRSHHDFILKCWLGLILPIRSLRFNFVIVAV